MPIRVNVDSHTNLVTLTCSGQLTYRDFAAAFEERVKHPHYKPDMNILYDLRVAAIDMTLPELKQSVTFFKTRQVERGTSFRLAVVTASVSTYGFVNLYQAEAEELPEEVRIFDNMPAARQWLGIED